MIRRVMHYDEKYNRMRHITFDSDLQAFNETYNIRLHRCLSHPKHDIGDDEHVPLMQMETQSIMRSQVNASLVQTSVMAEIYCV